MMRNYVLLAICAAVASASTVQAAITVDGTKDADYGAAKWVSQNLTSTQGSAIQAVYSVIKDDSLYMFFAGNLAPGGTRLDILIDDGTPGQNVLMPYSWGQGQGAYNRLTDSNLNNPNPTGGLKLDAGFQAGHYLTYAMWGNDGYMDYVNIHNPNATGGTGNTGHTVYNSDTQKWEFRGAFSPDCPPMTAGFNNTNTIGLTGTLPDSASLQSITTGYELAIPLSSLGTNVSTVKIAVFLANSANDFVYNQMIGLTAGYSGIGLTNGDLGDPTWRFKMNDSYPVNDGGLPGQQFIVTTPNPTQWTWNVNSMGDYHNPSNWSVTDGTGMPNVAGAIVNFGNAINKSRTIVMDDSVTAGTLNFNNSSASYYLAGSGALFIQAATGNNAAINVTSGTHYITPAKVEFASNTNIAIATGSSLTIGGVNDGVVIDPGMNITYSGDLKIIGQLNNLGTLTLTANSASVLHANATITGTGTINLTNNLAVFNNATTDDVKALLTSGKLSSSMTNDNLHALGYITGAQYLALTGGTFGGHYVYDKDVLVKYTYAGDSNLDGQITMDDYLQIDSGYLFGGTGWVNGDFNNDGVIDAFDYAKIDNSLLNQGSPLAQEMISLHASWFGANYAEMVTAVPEPASLALLPLAAAALLKRRR